MAVCALTFAGCKNTEERILYLQDLTLNKAEEINNAADIRLQPKDQVSIVVNSKDAELASLFNLVRARQTLGYTSGNVFGNSQGEICGYTIDDEGYIDFPQLGRVKIAGLNKSEVAAKIKNELQSNNLIGDPIVTVEFLNLYVSVLGEVAHPNKYSITKDRITIIEALTMAGDLTIHGRRDNIIVVREDNGIRTSYQVDLRSEEIFKSPVYFLKQNDAIYVQPSKVRTGQSTINENNFKSVSLWLSLASFLTTLAVVIFK